jgi:uncharacterized coiled-coil protein SlyX
MEELLKQILEQLKFQSQQIEKLTFVMAGLKQPCGKNAEQIKQVKEMLGGLGSAMKDHPMAPILNQMIKLAEEGGKEDGD